MMTTGSLALLALLLARPASASPEDKYVKQAMKLIDQQKYGSAEKQLAKALKAAPKEPEVHKALFWVNVTRYKLAAARKELNAAEASAKKRAAKFKTGKPHQLWNKYLADLYSLDVELTILENEKPLGAKLLKGKGDAKGFEAALGKVQRSYKQVRRYGTFISSIDDPIVDKTLETMLARASGDSGEEASAAPAPSGRSKGKGKRARRGRASTAHAIVMTGDEEEPGAEDGSAGGSDEEGADSADAGEKGAGDNP